MSKTNNNRSDSPLRRVSLYDLEETVIVVLEQSGIVYSNQTMGTMCMQPEAEGVLVPVGNDPPFNKPDKSLACHLSALLENVVRLDTTHADAVDALLRDSLISWVSVDRGRLTASHESWVFVNLDGDAKLSPLTGFGQARGVLTWPNSD